MRVTVREDEESDPLWPNDDYTAEWIIEWPSGALKYTATYIDGKEHGEVLCYWENGRFAQIGERVEGKCVGLWEDFYPDGTKFKQTYYDGSSNFTVKWLKPDGSVSEIQVFKDGIEITNPPPPPSP